jgi:hypothetical protein
MAVLVRGRMMTQKKAPPCQEALNENEAPGDLVRFGCAGKI